ncbi:FAD-binding oxidoreductase [Tropicimonas isoalkanivorans]|uniref:Decaprenylphospho-beta-D-ribofuranose 2-oxidase n=1 Tax=Tropicimonas isoalkanivorans TaxID=441112 RepID=A0A1I1IQP5_9RHOB|nr:FAD-binding oxidoreductase [Tropicimonas isoalkanivorans]SFC38554.1 decaprenylphospho-beta-D-ribofuranose 2-oxidase [Tropicimonas isoalkanivorans]
MTWKTTDAWGWGRVYRTRGEFARPERASALDRIAADSPCPAIGQRRSYADACLNSHGRTVLTDRLDRILSFDPDTGVLDAEAGCQLSEIVRLFAPRGWLPTVLPGTGFATVGGAIGMDVHGKNHHHAGSFGQHVASLTLHQPDGRSEVHPGEPLFEATVGGIGQTGPIGSARLQMQRIKGPVMMVTERRVPDLDTYLSLLDVSEAPYTVGWIDATASGASLGRGILEEAENGAGLVPPAKRGRTVPFDAPPFALAGTVVRGFNAAYYRRIPERGRTVVKPMEDFFFPLDKIYDWNRLYGKRGFHQFQCVVPLAERDVLRDMLAAVAASGLASPLAVLKRMGPGRAGMMSFPAEGYTLAIDFPAREEAPGMIRRLIAMADEAGGRVYLAKDAFAQPEQMDRMYPDRVAWAELVNARDPEGAYETDLVRRLALRTIQ